MNVLLNGERVDSDAPNLLHFLRDRGVDTDQRGIAVAVNNEVITRAHWDEYMLDEGDEVELITAMQGG